MIDNVNEKQDVVPDESKDTQEQSNTDSTAMEQVCVILFLVLLKLFLWISDKLTIIIPPWYVIILAHN